MNINKKTSTLAISGKVEVRNTLSDSTRPSREGSDKKNVGRSPGLPNVPKSSHPDFNRDSDTYQNFYWDYSCGAASEFHGIPFVRRGGHTNINDKKERKTSNEDSDVTRESQV